MTVPKLRFKEFDGNWYSNKIGEISECIVPGRNKPKKFNGDIPWVTTPDLQGNIYVSDTKSDSYISEDEAKNVGSKIVPVNSVIMSCVGDLGLFAINKKRIVINQQLHAFLLDNNKYDSLFILNALSKNKNYIDKVATKTALPYLNKDNCNSIPLYLSTFQEQTKIASFLSAVDEKISQLSQKHELLSQYKQGMMQKLFSQQIRFKADDGSAFGEWEEKQLGEIIKFVNGKGHENDVDSDGSYTLINSKFLSTNGSVTKKVNKCNQKVMNDSLVMVMSDVPNGKALAKVMYIQDGSNFALNQRIGMFIFHKDHYPKFFQYQLNRHQYYLAFDSGVGQTNLKKEDVLNCPILVPCIEEQTTIANFLSAIDQKIEVVTQQIEQAKQWKKGLLQHMFV